MTECIGSPFHPFFPHPCHTPPHSRHRTSRRTHRSGREEMPVSEPVTCGEGPEAKEGGYPRLATWLGCLIRFRPPASPPAGSRGCRGGHRLTGFVPGPREHPGSARMQASYIHSGQSHRIQADPPDKSSEAPRMCERSSAAPSKHPGKPPAQIARGDFCAHMEAVAAHSTSETS